VGTRVSVTGPSTASVLGDKQFTIANDGSGAGSPWGRAVTSAPGPVIDVPIQMVALGGDTIVATTPLAGGSFSGKIAVIYRGVSEFGHKALQAQNAGAVACVIVNNVPGGPVGMAAGTEGPSVTSIPVVMISKEDGDLICGQYRAGVAISMTITNWGSGKVNDLGFVPGGLSMWHAFAVPADQLSSGTPNAYKAVDGAFVANYGSASGAGVSLSSEMKFTPTGGSATSLHTSTVTLGAFAVADSIIAMFDTLSTATNVYSIAATTTGRFDQTYTINATTDDYLGNNVATNTFYATDSLYSKGRYDFTNKKPYCTLYSGRATAAEFIWGNMYYVNSGGAAVSNVQYSLSSNSSTPHALLDGYNNLYLYKWVDDGDNVMQNGELTMVGFCTRNYDASSSSVDTSGAILSATAWKPVGPGALKGDPVKLESNTWYLLALDVPSSYYVGCDGVLNQYPRLYGRRYTKTGESAHNAALDADAYLEYSNINITGDSSVIVGNPTDNNIIMPYIAENLIFSVDSFNYDNTKGMIPSISMIVNKNPAVIDHSHDGVKNINKTAVNATVFPNPSKDYITVSLELEKTAPVVTYTIIDGLARFVTKETSNNVKSEKHVINTSKLPAGNYDLIINANGEAAVTKFTVVK